MPKMPDSSQPTHPVTTGSFLFLGKRNILWDDKKCTLRNARTAVSLSHRKLLWEHSAHCCLLDCQFVGRFLLTSRLAVELRAICGSFFWGFVENSELSFQLFYTIHLYPYCLEFFGAAYTVELSCLCFISLLVS